MYTDIVQLKLDKLPSESPEGIPLAALGKKIFNRISSFVYLSIYFKVVEHVLISINNKIIYFLLVPKKEKFRNVRNHITINFWILMMHIIWLSMLFDGIRIIRKYSSVVQLIGQ